MQRINGKKPKPTFYYRVSESVHEIDADGNRVTSFNHEEDFKDDDLIKAREAAFNYYNVHHMNGPKGDFLYPFISSSEYEKGVPFAEWSLIIYIVEDYGEDNECTTSYFLVDENGDGFEESFELEKNLLAKVMIERIGMSLTFLEHLYSQN